MWGCGVLWVGCGWVEGCVGGEAVGEREKEEDGGEGRMGNEEERMGLSWTLFSLPPPPPPSSIVGSKHWTGIVR